MMTVVVICGGFTVDALIKRNIVSTTVARKTAETIGKYNLKHPLYNSVKYFQVKLLFW
jgi:hypothetical protein